jgi:hypothetical protein
VRSFSTFPRKKPKTEKEQVWASIQHFVPPHLHHLSRPPFNAHSIYTHQRLVGCTTTTPPQQSPAPTPRHTENMSDQVMSTSTSMQLGGAVASRTRTRSSARLSSAVRIPTRVAARSSRGVSLRVRADGATEGATEGK